MSKLVSTAVAAIAGSAMLALSFGPASAFTLSGGMSEQPVASSQIEKVWWRGCGWGHCGYGWGPGAVIGGLAAGAIIGGALAAPYYDPGYRHCWRGYYGHLHCNY
jgi:hypothetical protein